MARRGGAMRPPATFHRSASASLTTRRDAPSLADLARLTGLSRYQVLRRFERAYGLPPHAWLLRRRAERARVLIRDGCTLAAAALETGFADQSHMTRVFARQFGFTPGAWRRAARLQ